MSPASKSKSKDKNAGKEAPKSFSKPSGHVNTSCRLSATGYNPLLGAFQTFETTSGTSASSFHVNGRFRNIDDMDDHIGNSFGTATEYDSVSNNDSWSGESEDHKEKAPQPAPRQESVPGAENDKREKIRQKNEKKHLRQKERRAQELHERCSGYLMSRKLEALAQQLVVMGFSQERATMALILNEGRVEESVAWLFEGVDEEKHREHNLDGGGNLKIDISEELARISDMAIRYKVSKQEVERAVVSSEGDLDMAEETLKTQKQEPPATPPKPQALGDSLTIANGKVPRTLIQNAVRAQVRPTSSGIQQRDEMDFKYTKVAVGAGSSVDSGKSTQPLKKIPLNLEWAKPQHIAVPSDKRWGTAGSNPFVSYSLASSLQASPPPSKTETHYMAVRNELKNLQLASVREPVIVMQRPQSITPKQPPISSVSSSPPSTALGWYPKSVETEKAIGLVPPVAVTRCQSSNDGSSNLLYNPLHYQSQQQFISGSSSMDSQGISRSNGWWSRGGASPTIVPASSLGLFSGLGINGSSGSPSLVDWTTGSSIPQFDYSNIDWSLDPGLLSSSSRNGLWTAPNYAIQDNTRKYDSFPCSVGLNSATRPFLPNENGTSHPGFQERVSSSEPNNGGPPEWASPFEERDIFSLPRQFVSSPSH